mgnify:FL=1
MLAFQQNTHICPCLALPFKIIWCYSLSFWLAIDLVLAKEGYSFAKRTRPCFERCCTSKQWNKLKLFIWYLAWNCVYISDGNDFHLHDEMDIYIPLIGQKTCLVVCNA